MYQFSALEQIQAEQPRLYEAIENLRSKSAYGAMLIDCAVDLGVKIKIDENLPCAGVMGGWKVGGPFIAVNPEYADRFEEVIAHEVFHVVQFSKHGLRLPNTEGSLDNLIKTLVFCEAAAQTAGVRACFEIKLNGNEAPFKQSKYAEHSIKKYGWLFSVFEKGFETAKASGCSTSDALDEASMQTIKAYTENHELIKAYTQNLMFNYLLRTHQQKYALELPSEVFSSEYVEGFLKGPDGRKIAPMYKVDQGDLPAFKAKPMWRKMVDWADSQRKLSFIELEDTEKKEIEEHLNQTSNPFAGLSVRDVLVRHADIAREHNITQSGQAIFHVLGAMAGTEASRQMCFDFEPKNTNHPMKFPFS